MTAWQDPSDITFYCDPAYPVLAAAWRRAYSSACWGGKSIATFREVFDRTRAAAAFTVGPLAADVAANTVVHDTANNLLAQAAVGPLALTTFNAAVNWNGTNPDPNQTAGHEVGHVLGLGHSETPTDLMFKGYNGVTTPQPNDLDALHVIYPPVEAPIAMTINLVNLVLRSDGTVGGTWTQDAPPPPPPGDKVIDAPSSDTVTDGSGSVWGFTGSPDSMGYVITKNGSAPASGYFRGVRIGVKAGQFYVKNAVPAFYRWSGWGFQQISNDPFA